MQCGVGTLPPKKPKTQFTKSTPAVESEESSPKKSKKSVQQSIFGFCTVQTPTLTAKNEEERVKELFGEALNSLKNGKLFPYKQAIMSAQKLSEGAFKYVESEFFKFAALRNRKSDGEKNALYRKYDEMLDQFARNMYEDTSINPTPFPELQPAIADVKHPELYSQCLVISQFFVSFSTYLNTNLKFTAEDLLQALCNGAGGYYKFTGVVLTELLNALANHDLLKKHKFLNFQISNITWHASTASEACKLFLLRQHTPLTRTISPDEDKQLFTILDNNQSTLKKEVPALNPPLDKKLAKAFLDKDFHQLSPKQQVDLLEHLIAVIMRDNIFNKMLDPEECVLVPNEKVDQIKEELHEIRSEICKKRNRNAPKAVMEELNQKRKKLEAALANVDVRIKLVKLHKALKPPEVTLGYDRYHRRYYVFPNSFNKGIFIEEFCQVQIDEDPDFKGDQLAAELARYVYETSRVPMKSSQWYQIKNAEQLKEISNVLNKKGFRENLLAEALEKNEPLITKSFKIKREHFALDFDENESEIELMKKAAKTLFKKAIKGSFIHFSKKSDEIYEDIEAAESFENVRDLIVKWIPAILPCAFPLMAPGHPHFKLQAWATFIETCQSISQLIGAIQIACDQMRTDKVFGGTKKCPRCKSLFSDYSFNSKKSRVISCTSCYKYIHLHCHDTKYEVDPDPNLPGWICKTCKGPQETEAEKEAEKEEKENDENAAPIVEEKKVVIAANGRILRATRAREKKASESETGSSRASSRAGNRKRKLSSEAETDLSRESSEELPSRPSSRNSKWENSRNPEYGRMLRPRTNNVKYGED